jgi:Gas vesicle synthesis protein GvpL/GvpF
MGRAQTEAAKYVYGVVRADGEKRPRARGIGRKQVRVVRADGIAALTSDVPPGDLEAGKDELLAHSRVLERALEQGTVLPMRFGVVMPSESAVREELLDPHRSELEAQLAEMDGKVEVNVKGIYDEGALLTEVVSEDREVAGLREALRGQPEEATHFERIRLGEIIAGAVNEKRERDSAEILERLAAHAVAVEVGDPVHERMALNASFLIDRSAQKGFDSELDRIAAEQGDRMRFKYTGPLAPHSFVELAMRS